MFHSRSWVSGTVPEEIEWDYSKPSIGLGDDTLVSLGVFLGLDKGSDICTCLEAAVNSKKKREESAGIGTKKIIYGSAGLSRLVFDVGMQELSKAVNGLWDASIMKQFWILDTE
ncbi:hypothetical protein Tco_0658918 [Tanacetum coccineum]